MTGLIDKYLAMLTSPLIEPVSSAMMVQCSTTVL